MYCPADFCLLDDEEVILEKVLARNCHDIGEIRKALRKGDVADALILFNRLFPE